MARAGQRRLLFAAGLALVAFMLHAGHAAVAPNYPVTNIIANTLVEAQTATKLLQAELVSLAGCS